MDIAEIATMAFIASGMTYNAVKYWRVNRKVHLAGASDSEANG